MESRQGQGYPLCAPRVRQGLQYAIDRQALVKKLFKSLKPKLTVLHSNMYCSRRRATSRCSAATSSTRARSASSCRSSAARGAGTESGSALATGCRSSSGRRPATGCVSSRSRSCRRRPRVRASVQGRVPARRDVLQRRRCLRRQLRGRPVRRRQRATPARSSPPSSAAERRTTASGATRRPRRILAGDNELDPAKRAAAVNQAEAIMSINTPRFPLYQKPTYFVYKTKVRVSSTGPWPARRGTSWNGGSASSERNARYAERSESRTSLHPSNRLEARPSSTRTFMGIFILRRVLYSIPVLIATSFIIFTFVSLAGDPLGQLKLNPYLSKVSFRSGSRRSTWTSRSPSGTFTGSRRPRPRSRDDTGRRSQDLGGLQARHPAHAPFVIIAQLLAVLSLSPSVSIQPSASTPLRLQ